MTDVKKNRYKIRINTLQETMRKQGIDLMILPMCDYHGSEYIGDYFKTIRYYSGFTGSAASMVVTQTEAYLWTDGRYFLQAENQLAGTDISLMKQGEENVPTITEFVASFRKNHVNEELVVAFDGRLVNGNFVQVLFDKVSCASDGKKLKLVYEKDFAGEIWQQDQTEKRPDRRADQIWVLEKAYTGKSIKEKLDEIRKYLETNKADVLILTCLDEIAYLTNLRGNDIAYTPVFLSYMMIQKEKAFLYLQKESINENILSYLNSQEIEVCDYEQFYEDVKALSSNQTVYYDPMSANYLLQQLIPESCKTIQKESPVILQKAVKNETEYENEKKAHIKDGVAVTRFIHWLKTRIRTGLESTTEIQAAQKLEEFRKQGENYLGQSFAPIIAYKEHGAIVHYSADETSDVVLGNESFLLADTGGHYLEGTTDITRTVVMGSLSDEQKKMYTAVLCGNLRLMDAKFKLGSQGANLDYLAREPLYRLGLDFNHGTGHGVGYLLNVHEGPNAFRQKVQEGSSLLEGMITSDEPGYYEDGSYGIRLENLILCIKKEKTKYGQFMGFIPLTMVPFDLEAVDVSLMENRDIQLLNAYHEQVYQTIHPYLSDEQARWLRQETRPLIMQ